jgi:hypothetical protein
VKRLTQEELQDLGELGGAAVREMLPEGVHYVCVLFQSRPPRPDEEGLGDPIDVAAVGNGDMENAVVVLTAAADSLRARMPGAPKAPEGRPS